MESFEEVEMQKTKYSFSTKIIDYLQSGSVILAIGPKDISSMRYLSNIPGVVSINDVNDLIFVLKEMIENSGYFIQRAYDIRDYAQRHHGNQMVSQILNEIINKTNDGGE